MYQKNDVSLCHPSHKILKNWKLFETTELQGTENALNFIKACYFMLGVASFNILLRKVPQGTLKIIQKLTRGNRELYLG